MHEFPTLRRHTPRLPMRPLQPAKGMAGVELVLEPLGFEPAKGYQKALFEAGIPATAFITSDVHAEKARLVAKGVRFRGEPVHMGPIIAVMFEDTCGNLLHLVQPLVTP